VIEIIVGIVATVAAGIFVRGMVNSEMDHQDKWKPREWTGTEQVSDSQYPGMDDSRTESAPRNTIWSGGYHRGCGTPLYDPSNRNQTGYTETEWAAVREREHSERMIALGGGQSVPVSERAAVARREQEQERSRPIETPAPWRITVSPIERPGLPAGRQAQLPAPRRELPQGDVVEGDWIEIPQKIEVRR
jgi:hypothetical protein